MVIGKSVVQSYKHLCKGGKDTHVRPYRNQFRICVFKIKKKCQHEDQLRELWTKACGFPVIPMLCKWDVIVLVM